MTFDLYAELAGEPQCPARGELPTGLASGFVDGCTAGFATAEIKRAQYDGLAKKEDDEDKKKKLQNQVKKFENAENDARNCYLKQAQAADLRLPRALEPLLDPAPCVLQPGWLAIKVRFTLKTPWYSKDDRLFHVLDNPVRKDRVFGVPHMSAASWKGLLRWSCRMEAGLFQHLEAGKPIDDWQDPPWVVHLFGNEKGASDDFQRGALAFYPTWFPRIGFEVINPHSRKTRAGTQPIYYEVVRSDAKGVLKLLYAPSPGATARDGVQAPDALNKLLDATEKLLTVYGFSAKRTVGWGLASVDEWVVRNTKRSHKGGVDDVKAKLAGLLGTTEAAS